MSQPNPDIDACAFAYKLAVANAPTPWRIDEHHPVKVMDASGTFVLRVSMDCPEVALQIVQAVNERAGFKASTPASEPGESPDAGPKEAA